MESKVKEKGKNKQTSKKQINKKTKYFKDINKER
jgi:hypothetical protein